MEGTSVCWCLTARVSFPSDEWSCPGALPESSGVDHDTTSFCLLRNKTWPLKQLRVWCDTAGQEALACVFVTSTFKGILSVGLLEAVKMDTPRENGLRVFGRRFQVVYRLHSQASPRSAAQRHSSVVRLSPLVGRSSDTFGLAFLPDD